MKEGLVRYTGKRRGKFPQRVGRYPSRTWCIAQPHHERWLAEAEAALWQKAGPWRVMRWRESTDPEPVAVVATAPAPPAIHVANALDQAAEATVQAKEKREVVDARFVLSDNGVVHASDCRNAPKSPAKTFDSLERAMADEDFNRSHQQCCRKHLRALNAASLPEGAIAHINVMGEGFGLGQDQA